MIVNKMNFNFQASRREESYEAKIKDYSARLKDVNFLNFIILFLNFTINFNKQAEQKADLAERTMAKLQKEVDRLEGLLKLLFQKFFYILFASKKLFKMNQELKE